MTVEFQQRRAAHIAARRFSDAYELEEVELDRRPDDINLLFNRAWTLSALKRMDEAAEVRARARRVFDARMAEAKDAQARKMTQLLELVATDMGWTSGAVDAGTVARIMEPHPLDIPDWIRFFPEIAAVGEVVEIPEIGQFEIRDPSHVIDKRLVRAIPWELANVALLSALVQALHPEAEVLDVGANVGSIIVPLALHHPSRRFNAFEPAPETFAALERNLALNSCTNVHAERVGCGSASGRVRFDLGPAENPGEARVSEDGTHEIELVRLDDAMEGRRTGLMKIDVEGAELSVLEGAERILREDRPLVLCEILHGSEKSVFSYFEERGYAGEHVHFRDYLFRPVRRP